MKMRLFILTLCSMLIGTVQAATDTRTTETKLAESLMAIKNNHLDLAMNEVDSLLRVNPNYKLAQLVKGDLLMAKAGAITSFGSAPHGSGDKIQDLRDEARVRIQRAQAQPQTQHAPRYLWKLNAQQ